MTDKLKLYGASFCVNCPPMKLWLTQQGVDVEYISLDDLDETPEGLRSIPAINVDGEWIVGDSIKEYVLEEM